MPRTDTAVVVVFKSRDQLSKALDRIARKSDTTSNRVKKSLEKINKAAMRTKSIMGGMLGATAVSHGLFLISMGARRVTGDFVGLDQALTSAGAKFPESIGRGTEAFKELEAASRKVGGSTEFTSKAAGEGLEFLAMAGFNAKQAVSVLPSVVDLATSANMDLARATDIASDALGAFNMNSKDTEVLTENLNRINDVFAATTTSANVTLEDMFETMKDGGPVMTAAGQSVETFAALAGVMGNAGIKGSKAGTTLKNMMLKLAAPADKAKNLMKKLGVVVADNNGDMRDAIDILEDLEKATANMGTQQRSAAFDTILGKRAIAGANVIMLKGVGAARKYRTELEKARGSSAKMAEMMRKGLGNRLKVLQSSLIELGFKILETFQDAFPGALDATISAIQNFNPQPMIDGIKTLIDVGKSIYQFMVDWKPLIVAVGGAIISLKIALGAATLAMKIFNLVTALNPIMLIIMAIGALIAVLWVYRDELGTWADRIGETLVGMVDEINLAMVNMGIAIFNAMAKAWNWIVDLFASGLSKVMSLVASATAVLGVDLNLDGAQKAIDSVKAGASVDLLEEKTFDDVRKARQQYMGLPQMGLAEEIGLRDSKNGAAPPARAPRVNADSLAGAFDQNTSVDINLDFKNLTEDFGQQITVDSSSRSSSGPAKTTVNKKRAGSN